jgi:Pyruvate/2-oxoacid:ferredoxin oxidoreductase gamma subunit
MFQTRIHGLGGQGVLSASQILAIAASREMNVATARAIDAYLSGQH